MVLHLPPKTRLQDVRLPSLHSTSYTLLGSSSRGQELWFKTRPLEGSTEPGSSGIELQAKGSGFQEYISEAGGEVGALQTTPYLVSGSLEATQTWGPSQLLPLTTLRSQSSGIQIPFSGIVFGIYVKCLVHNKAVSPRDPEDEPQPQVPAPPGLPHFLCIPCFSLPPTYHLYVSALPLIRMFLLPGRSFSVSVNLPIGLQGPSVKYLPRSPCCPVFVSPSLSFCMQAPTGTCICPVVFQSGETRSLDMASTDLTPRSCHSKLLSASSPTFSLGVGGNSEVQ